MNKELINQIVKEYEAGKTYWEIANMFNRPYCTVRYNIIKNSTKIRTKEDIKRLFKGENNKTRKYCGEISGERWARILVGAKSRDIEFYITQEFAWNLFLSQKRKCKLTGLSIDFNDKTASLDRIDSSLPYTNENVQWIHKDINIMKHDYSQKDFIKMCKKISNYQRSISHHK